MRGLTARSPKAPGTPRVRGGSGVQDRIGFSSAVFRSGWITSDAVPVAGWLSDSLVISAEGRGGPSVSTPGFSPPVRLGGRRALDCHQARGLFPRIIRGKEDADRNIETSGGSHQHRRRHPIGPAFVLLDLLKGDAQSPTQLAPRHPLRDALLLQPLSDVNIHSVGAGGFGAFDRIRPACLGRHCQICLGEGGDSVPARRLDARGVTAHAKSQRPDRAWTGADLQASGAAAVMAS